MVKSEDYALFFLAVGFGVVSVLQMSHIPNYWAQYSMGIVVFFVALLSVIVSNTYRRQEILVETKQ